MSQKLSSEFFHGADDNYCRCQSDLTFMAQWRDMRKWPPFDIWVSSLDNRIHFDCQCDMHNKEGAPPLKNKNKKNNSQHRPVFREGSVRWY